MGFLICEDGWNDHGADYAANPFQRLADAAPDLVISIHASPSQIGKREQRQQIFGDAARHHGLPILYVNQMGGHDQLVYDGASFAVEPVGGIVFEARRFTEDLCTLQFNDGHFLTSEGRPPEAVSAQAYRPTTFTASKLCWACATMRAAVDLPKPWSVARAASTAL